MTNPSTTFARRPMDAEDFLDALRRRRAWWLGTLLVALVCAVVGAYLWPETYQSTAVLRVQNPILQPSVLASPLGTTLSDRIAEMATSITSRSMLQSIISTYNLYPSEMKRMPAEDVVELMRRDIQISPVQTINVGTQKGVTAFSIRFSYRDRFLAHKVVAELVSRFTAESLRNRGQGQSLALVFGKSQTDEARAKLDTAERKLADFRTLHQGNLPDQTESALQQMNALQMRFSMLQNSTARATQELLMLKTNLGIDEEKAAAVAVEASRIETAPRAKSDRLLAMEREMTALDAVVAALADQYTAQHPDLRAARQRRERLSQEHDRLALQEAATAASSPVKNARTVASSELQDNIRRYRSQIEAKSVELADLNQESKRINAQLQALDARIQSAPGLEREYGERIRERELAKAEFVDKETRYRKLSDSSEGETARLFESLEQLDAASLPLEPIEPKRPWIVALGSMMGLLVGLTLVGAREWRDPALKNLKDVRSYTGFSVLSSIPEIENDLVVKRRRRIEFLAWAAAVTLSIISMAGAIAYSYATRS
jgi:polysaccharide biosynthesis transport protein